jgi:hypothetical protein
MRARVDKSDAINMEAPKIQLDLEVDEVGLGLNSGQYRRMLDLVDLFTLYSRNLPCTYLFQVRSLLCILKP